jgi:hypothetical protein
MSMKIRKDPHDISLDHIPVILEESRGDLEPYLYSYLSPPLGPPYPQMEALTERPPPQLRVESKAIQPRSLVVLL